MIFCIHSKRRLDRVKHIDQLKSLISSIEIVEPVPAYPPHVSCTKTHFECIRRAHAAHAAFALVFEDDAILLGHVARFFSTLDEFVHSPYSFLLGGVSFFKYAKPSELPGCVEVVRFSSTHCIVYNAHAFDDILAETPNTYTDILYSNMKEHRAVVTVPFFSTQAPGYSDLAQRETDYSSDFKRIEQQLQKFLP